MNSGKKKVFICITKANWGGAQKYVFDIATSLPKEQFDVTVVFGGDGLMKEKLEKAGIKIEKLRLENKIGLLKNLAEFFEVIKIVCKNKPDILHLNSSKMGIMGTFAGRICNMIRGHNTKMVFTAHGWAFNEDRPFWQRVLLKIVYWKTVFMSHKTICVSSNIKSQMEHLPFVKRKLEIINNGINDIDFIDRALARKKILEKIGSIDNKSLGNKWIGTISELHKNKGLEYAIRAFAKIENSLAENLSFIIIGEGDERKYLEKIISELGLSGKIFMIGKVDDAEKYLKAFDIFTLTSITEALGYVILEAGYAELPTVASAVGGIPEIIEDMKSGILIKPKNPDEIAKSIEFILKNPEKALFWAENLREKVCRDFNINEMIRKTVDIYNEQCDTI